MDKAGYFRGQGETRSSDGRGSPCLRQSCPWLPTPRSETRSLCVCKRARMSERERKSLPPASHNHDNTARQRRSRSPARRSRRAARREDQAHLRVCVGVRVFVAREGRVCRHTLPNHPQTHTHTDTDTGTQDTHAHRDTHRDIHRYTRTRKRTQTRTRETKMYTRTPARARRDIEQRTGQTPRPRAGYHHSNPTREHTGIEKQVGSAPWTEGTTTL